MRARLVELGRKKFSGQVSFRNLRGLELQIQRHIRSRSWDLSYENGSSRASILVGFRKLGEVHLLDGWIFNQVQTDYTLLSKKAGTSRVES